MYRQFPLFQTAIDHAHSLWRQLLRPGDLAVDATCGNGHDTLLLAELVGPTGRVIAMDIQEEAVTNTRGRLIDRTWVTLLHQSHAVFPLEAQNARLVVYNLGYLPGGDKNLTTEKTTTLESLEQALSLVCPGGALSVTLYPGHEQGTVEADAVLAFSQTLSPSEWNATHLQWTNRRRAPSLLLLQKGN